MGSADRIDRWLFHARLYRTRPLAQQAATAEETQHVLQRLHYLGYVQPDPAYGGRGRPANRWLVNPALVQHETASGNSGKSKALPAQ